MLAWSSASAGWRSRRLGGVLIRWVAPFDGAFEALGSRVPNSGAQSIPDGVLVGALGGEPGGAGGMLADAEVLHRRYSGSVTCATY